MKGESAAMRVAAAVETIRVTPPQKRSEFTREIWKGAALRRSARVTRFCSLKVTDTKNTEDEGECHTETHAGGHQPQHVDGVKGFEPRIAGHVHQGDEAKDHENNGLSSLHQPLRLSRASALVHSGPFPWSISAHQK